MIAGPGWPCHAQGGARPTSAPRGIQRALSPQDGRPISYGGSGIGFSPGSIASHRERDEADDPAVANNRHRAARRDFGVRGSRRGRQPKVDS